MSRVEYNESDDQWSYIRWAGAAKRAIEGRRGQEFLRELKDALEALPEPKLIADEFMTHSGEVCALGAVARVRGIDMAGIDVGPNGIEIAHRRLGITPTLAWEIMAQNDDGPEGAYCDSYWGREITPEVRYNRVLRWVYQNIKEVHG